MNLLAAVPGFTGNQTSLNPVGPGAAHIEREFVLIFWITGVVYCLVLVALMITVWRRRDTLATIPDAQPTSDADDRFASRAVAGAMVITIVLLFIMLVGSFRTSHALGSMNYETALTINIIGHQWWAISGGGRCNIRTTASRTRW